VLKCSRSNGSWFESVVGRLLVMTNDLTGATAEAFSVGIKAAPRTVTTRVIAVAKRLVTDTQY